MQVNLDIDTLLGLAEYPGMVDLLGPLTAAEVRRFIDQYADEPDTTVTIGVADRRGRIRVLVPSSTRYFRGWAAEAIRSIHDACYYPTCDTPALGCELDHREEYQLTRQTTIDNGAPGCRAHHQRAKHKDGWKVTERGQRAYQWTSPHGHTYLSDTEKDPPPF